MISKKRKIANAKVDANKAYTLSEASSLVKEVNTTKFDSSIDLHVKLGVDPKKSRPGHSWNRFITTWYR